MNKIEKAKRALIDSGFIMAFYFIRKVQEGNKVSTNVRTETSTRKWGWETLRRLEGVAMKNHPNIKSEIAQVSFPYFDELSTLHHGIIDQILDNQINEHSK